MLDVLDLASGRFRHLSVDDSVEAILEDPSGHKMWLGRELPCSPLTLSRLISIKSDFLLLIPIHSPGGECACWSRIGLEISGVCFPAMEVGGDFFEYLGIDPGRSRLTLALGDVSGKGMNAAMTAVMAIGMLHRET
jgi:hypothetical protein